MKRTGVRTPLVAVLTTLLLLTGVVAVRAGAASQGPEGRSTAVRVVRAGDTLWGIARELLGPEADPRPLIADIRETNSLSSSNLAVGMRLVLPS